MTDSSIPVLRGRLKRMQSEIENCESRIDTLQAGQQKIRRSIDQKLLFEEALPSLQAPTLVVKTKALDCPHDGVGKYRLRTYVDEGLSEDTLDIISEHTRSVVDPALHGFWKDTGLHMCLTSRGTLNFCFRRAEEREIRDLSTDLPASHTNFVSLLEDISNTYDISWNVQSAKETVEGSEEEYPADASRYQKLCEMLDLMQSDLRNLTV